MLDVRVSDRPSAVCPSARFSFPCDNLSKHQWNFTKLGMCINIVEIWFGSANGQISSNFYGIICPFYSFDALWRVYSSHRWYLRTLSACVVKAMAHITWIVPVNVWLGKLTALYMTHWVYWAVKLQHNQTWIVWRSDALIGLVFWMLHISGRFHYWSGEILLDAMMVEPMGLYGWCVD